LSFVHRRLASRLFSLSRAAHAYFSRNSTSFRFRFNPSRSRSLASAHCPKSHSAVAPSEYASGLKEIWSGIIPVRHAFSPISPVMRDQCIVAVHLGKVGNFRFELTEEVWSSARTPPVLRVHYTRGAIAHSQPKRSPNYATSYASRRDRPVQERDALCHPVCRVRSWRQYGISAEYGVRLHRDD